MIFFVFANPSALSLIVEENGNAVCRLYSKAAYRRILKK